LLDQVGDRLGHAIHLQATQHDDDGGAGRIMTHDDLPRSGHAGHRNVRRWPWARFFFAHGSCSVCLEIRSLHPLDRQIPSRILIAPEPKTAMRMLLPPSSVGSTWTRKKSAGSDSRL